MEGETDGLEWKGGTRATKCARSAPDWLWLSQIPAWLPYKLTWPLTVKTREHLIKPTFKKNSIYHGCARISDQENQTQTACKRGPSFSLTWAKILTWDARGVPLFSVCKDRREVISPCLEGGVFKLWAHSPCGPVLCSQLLAFKSTKEAGRARGREVLFALSLPGLPNPGKRRIWKQHWERVLSKHWHNQAGGRNGCVLAF